MCMGPFSKNESRYPAYEKEWVFLECRYSVLHESKLIVRSLLFFLKYFTSISPQNLKKRDSDPEI